MQKNLAEFIAPFLKRVIESDKSSDIEIEACLGGTFEGDVFQSGVDFNYFSGLLASFEAAAADDAQLWEKRGPTQSVCYFFPGDVRGTYQLGKKAVWQRKQKIASATVKTSSPRRYDLRFNVKSEIATQAPEISRRVASHLRILKRTTFVYDKLFLYTFTVVCSGVNKEAAASGEKKYEIELEIDSESFRQCYTNKHADCQSLASVFSANAFDLLGTETSEGEEQGIEVEGVRIATTENKQAAN